jgi:peptidyl-prolyl cis-trans isomerase A (cyclophilin A)
MSTFRAASTSLILMSSIVLAAPVPGAARAASGQAAASEPVAVITTSMGEIRIKLLKDKAPISVQNFVDYVNKKFYDGTVFHRVIPTFMIQGGGHLPDLTRKTTGPAIKLESQNGLKNVRGSVAMARTADPNSATAQFFINVVDNSGRLDYPKPDGHGYAVFGEVIAGMDVVDKIRAVPTTSQNGMQDVPAKPVVIESIRLASQ